MGGVGRQVVIARPHIGEDGLISDFEGQEPTTEFGCRNQSIILLLLDTGIRASELLPLTLADIQWEERRIHIRHGKGRKQRVVPLSDRPAAALRYAT